MKFTYAVITVSDTCFNNAAEDRSGPCLIAAVQDSFPNAIKTNQILVPDEVDYIANTLRMLCDNEVNLILTTGGTGLSKRDVTPEATKQVINKEIPGIPQAMLMRSLEVTNMAMLSRAVAGTRGNSLIINFPGSSKGAIECFGFIKSIITHALQIILDQKEDIKKTHKGLEGSIGGNNNTEGSKVRIDQIAMRNRVSPYRMVPFEEALEIVHVETIKQKGGVEEINIEYSLNRILAKEIVSAEPFPPFRASIKDGYAVRAEDGVGERIVKDMMAAGDDPLRFRVGANEAVRISTGASVPEGADAVVQVEDTDLVESDNRGNEIKIMIKTLPVVGQDIRPIGSDIPANMVVFRPRETISPAHIGVFATLGYTKVNVFKRPSIGLISTGNELCAYNAKEIPPGHIRDSNKITLLNLLQKYGYTANDCGIVKDTPDLLKQALEVAFRRHDIVITTGGVSMGEFDLMKEVLKKDFGATIHFGRVDMKPGKPTTFATCKFEGSEKLIFALPGNPVSAAVTFMMFVLPSLRIYENAINIYFKKITVRISKDIVTDERPEFRRVTLRHSDSDYPYAYEMGDQISSRLNSCAGADALLIVPSKRVQKTFLKDDIMTAFVL